MKNGTLLFLSPANIQFFIGIIKHHGLGFEGSAVY